MKDNTIFQQGRFLFLCTIISLLCLFQTVQANYDTIGQFEYLDIPQAIHNKTMFVPENTVAMSDYVHIGTPVDTSSEKLPVSIFFIIDVSASNVSDKTDYNGVRFDVMSDIVDSLYNKHPENRVGLIMFASGLWGHQPDDPNQLARASKGGAYLRLLQLNRTYTGTFVETDIFHKVKSRTPYTGTGREVLKLYLRTKKYEHVVGGQVPRYWPSQSVGKLTNITEAFEASKEGFANSPHPKKRHYNIFLSDGLATEGGDGYVQGSKVATTFTIFYKANSNDLQKLQQMTENIKTNNYSISNKWSNIWNMAMNKEQLKKLISDNVLTKIVTSTTTMTSQSVKINGLDSTAIIGSDSTGFFFKSYFPLKQKVTPFNYEIIYKTTMDSIDENGKVITIDLGDTTVNIDYEVDIDGTVPVTDSVKMTHWGRTIKFFHKGNEITYVEKDMDELEIRFTPFKVDTVYDYKDVEIELTNLDNNNKDIETLKLKKNGNFFSAKFKRSIATAKKGDGKLQHSSHDTFRAVFRNPDLPLDTLQREINYYSNFYITLEDGTYFDKNADGKVDHVVIEAKGPDVKKHFKKIVQAVELPKYRKFDQKEPQYIGNDKIEIPVTEKMNGVMTYTTSDDKFELKDSVQILKDLYLMPSKITFKDSVAPILMKASFTDKILYIKNGNSEDGKEPVLKVVDLKDDILKVEFSEDIENVKKNEPLKFYHTKDKKVYDIELKVDKQSKNKVTFITEKYKGVKTIVKGDSAYINWIDKNIYDEKKNNQGNKDNLRRLIKVDTTEVDSFIFVIPELEFTIKLPVLQSQNMDKYKIPKDIRKKFNVKNKEDLKNYSLIVIEPTNTDDLNKRDKLVGSVQIFDALGNQILSTKDMYFYRPWKRLVYLWDRKNNLGRPVGTGAHFVQAQVTHTFNKGNKGGVVPVQTKKLSGTVPSNK